MRGGVIAGDCVLGEQEAQRQYVEPEARAVGASAIDSAIATAEEPEGVIDLPGENVGNTPVSCPLLQEEEQDDHDDGRANDVPPHRDVVEDR
ncbi:unannotated protein [freshwater metagenome]|uniref:Unannotated protein n=1 Tax=freshwater metagenome TaxID=449393 RepID=A0A6J6TUH7_9ZZZZ